MWKCPADFRKYNIRLITKQMGGWIKYITVQVGVSRINFLLIVTILLILLYFDQINTEQERPASKTLKNIDPKLLNSSILR